ncbi:MAG: LytTR family DNA-binding domain-containing protein [Anaerostipes sp.]|nr:LytTR family DNA-binding domain-containing protein [Anaerostipes sp.]
MKVCICDDEEIFIQGFEKLLRKYVKETNLKFEFITFAGGNELLSYCNIDNDIDILFLDIRMKLSNGIDVAQKIRNRDGNIIIIFLTSLSQYSLSGYKVKAFDYMIKPISYNLFKEVMTSAIVEATRSKEKCLVVKNTEGIFKLCLIEITYLETYNRNVQIHLQSGKKVIGYLKMKEYENILDDSFYRCHSSYIVNMRYITSIEKNNVNMNIGTQIPVSRYRRKKFEDAFTNFLGNSFNL